MNSPLKPVIVGVSPTSGSPAALKWAQEEARLRNAPLRVVMAWRPPRPPGAPGGRPPAVLTPEHPDTDALARLRVLVISALGADSGAELRAERGLATTVLARASAGAQLLVLGEPRPGRLANVQASLLAPKLLHRTWCPVVVMPAPETPRSNRLTRVAEAIASAAAQAGRPRIGQRDH
jgi:nucleotide-binding universal stress UspA family protein